MSKIKCNFVFIKEEYFKQNRQLDEMLDPYDIGKQIQRQYVFLKIQYKDNNILVPLRSELPFNKKIGDIGYPVPSKKKTHAGLDFRKILIVNNPSYIELSKYPKIPKSQQQIIEQNYPSIEKRVLQYINGYIKSALKKREKRDKKYKFSTLHNFHDALGIIKHLTEKKKSQQEVAVSSDDA
ncbi:MAG: hypothetical protein N4A62_03220 [Marinisporobacter sp.]|jgi:hypothetical protein|nr:hypothetical protein [Marinisporobacter sp.]